MKKIDRNNPIITIRHADRRPESIASVIAIVEIIGDKKTFGSIQTKGHSFDGTVEEKLLKYKEIFDKDWPGFDKIVITEYPLIEDSNRGIFNVSPKKYVHPTTVEAQKKIDELTQLARQYLLKNALAKRTKTMQKIPVETSVGSGTHENYLAGY
jgi:hypothetical protein